MGQQRDYLQSRFRTEFQVKRAYLPDRLILHLRISQLVLESKDRLLRFGIQMVIRLCESQGIKVVIIEDKYRSFEVDLARDVREARTLVEIKQKIGKARRQDVRQTALLVADCIPYLSLESV